MRRFEFEHRRQRKYKAALFMFIVLLTSLIYFNYGKPTGFVASDEINVNILLHNAMANEQVALFLEYHPQHSIAFRELDYLELQLAKERKPDVYAALQGEYYEAEFISGNARIVAILDEDGKVVKVYNPSIE